MLHQEILEEVFRELHKVKDEIIDGMFHFVLKQTKTEGLSINVLSLS